jgi:recombination protein RecA
MRARVKVVKNKLAPPFRDAEFDIIYGQGISRTGSILDVGSAMGIISRSGTWFTYGDLRLGQGRENAREFLDNNPEVAREIDRKVRDARGIGKPREPSVEVPPAATASEPAPRPVPARARG